MTRPAALMFDLDGTLVDSRPDLSAAVNEVRASLGLPALSEETVGAAIGNGARMLVQRTVGPDTDDETVERVFPDFLRVYTGICTKTTRPFPGIVELLDRLGREWPDVPKAVVTNKPAAITTRVLDALDLARHFRLAIGGDTLPTRKPDPAGVHHVCREFGVESPSAMLIGDSPVDANTAVAAPCRSALCYWGFSTTDALDACDAGLRAANVPELEAALFAL